MLIKGLLNFMPEDLLKDKLYCVNYVEYIGSSGYKEHFYIAVRHDKFLKFKAVLDRGNFDAEEYGIILEKGAGSAPSYVRDKMKMLYKCEHKNAINVKDYLIPEKDLQTTTFL